MELTKKGAHRALLERLVVDTKSDSMSDVVRRALEAYGAQVDREGQGDIAVDTDLDGQTCWDCPLPATTWSVPLTATTSGENGRVLGAKLPSCSSHRDPP